MNHGNLKIVAGAFHTDSFHFNVYCVFISKQVSDKYAKTDKEKRWNILEEWSSGSNNWERDWGWSGMLLPLGPCLQTL